MCEGYGSDHIKSDSKLSFSFFEGVQALVCVDTLSICTVLSNMQ